MYLKLINVFDLLYYIRYQRLVPGRENIAAEHLVPQLGYVATSKAFFWLHFKNLGKNVHFMHKYSQFSLLFSARLDLITLQASFNNLL